MNENKLNRGEFRKLKLIIIEKRFEDLNLKK